MLYLRVSTGRQAVNDVSLPSQRDIATTHCATNNWIVVGEYVEAATATDDRRPVFQQMIDFACDPDKPFDVIVCYAFNRFYRNIVDMELAIKKLRKHGVEVVSVTQPTGDDHSRELVRQLIGVFDEHTSREISKNTTRAMRESAKQGFWNGATPPLGYKIVEAEKRGLKIKKKLAIDDVEAETVRLIFRLYLEGDGTTGPLGVKENTKWLNSHGLRTRRGSNFGVGPVHKILTNACYSTGLWPYGKRDFRNEKQHDPSALHLKSRCLFVGPGGLRADAGETGPEQSEDHAAARRERAVTSYRHRRLRFVWRRHDPDGNRPPWKVLRVLQLCRMPAKG